MGERRAWWERLLAIALSERGLGALLSLILVGALLYGLAQAGAAESAASARTAAGYAAISGELERINGRLTELERLLVAHDGRSR
jgi:hypothetical protein